MTEPPVAAIGSCLVVGTGLIGTSIALALRRAGVDVHLSDRDPQSVRTAADLGAGIPEPPTDQVDLAVVAVTPAATAEVAVGLITANVAATVVDTASVKARICRDVQDAVGAAPHFVGTHPMAGRERSGPGAARSDLFEGRPWVITPGDAEERSLQRARALVRLCGAAPVELDPATHDSAVALVSHLPQVAASLVAARLADGPAQALDLTGQGLRDVTRIAASDADLWVEILEGNAEPVARLLAELRQDVDALLHALHEVSDDPDWGRTALREVLLRGNAGQARLPGKHGGRPPAYSTVAVVVPDEPGQLARLFADAGRAGVNIEDVRIEHSPGQPVGLVELAVEPAGAPPLRAALADLGWVVHPATG